MKSPVMMPALVQRYRALTQSVSPREQRLLRIVFTALSLLGTLAAADALRAEHARLAQELPRQAATLARLEHAATELNRLRNKAPHPTPITLPALAAHAQAHGLDAELQPHGNNGFRVSGRATLSRLAPWLAGLHADYSLRVIEMHFGEAGGDGYVVVLGQGGPDR